MNAESLNERYGEATAVRWIGFSIVTMARTENGGHQTAPIEQPLPKVSLLGVARRALIDGYSASDSCPMLWKCHGRR